MFWSNTTKLLLEGAKIQEFRVMAMKNGIIINVFEKKIENEDTLKRSKKITVG